MDYIKNRENQVILRNKNGEIITRLWSKKLPEECHIVGIHDTKRRLLSIIDPTTSEADILAIFKEHIYGLLYSLLNEEKDELIKDNNILKNAQIICEIVESTKATDDENIFGFEFSENGGMKIYRRAR